MGLIRAALGAFNGTMADQWKEFFYCDSLESDVLMAKGQKRITGRSSNTRGNDNIITSGSGIAVNEGQFMIIVENGKIVDYCGEPGQYTWDASTEPSLFNGGFKEGIKNTFATIGKRFTYGGDPGKDQRVYYFNMKEILDNKFGTANPIPFRVVDRNINLDIDVNIRANGVYSYQITDPLKFYTRIAGNVKDVYRRSDIDSQLKTEFISALQPAFAAISELEIRPNAVPAHAEELCEAMNKALSEKWGDLRGISVVSIALNPLSLPEEDQELIKQAQRTGMYKDPSMGAAAMTNAYSEAMQNAAKNENGAMMGFMGMNMAQNAAGMNAGQLYDMAEKQKQAQPTISKDEWTCTCGTKNTGNFCVNCGNPKPVGWTCECGTVNKGKFCSNCGKPKPAGAPLYKCDKCGWEPEDPHNPPKFCPECGDPFNDNDIVK